MQPKKLEEYKYFQPIAWTICLTFAAFVGLLALQLQSVISDLEQSDMSIEKRVQDLEDAVYKE